VVVDNGYSIREAAEAMDVGKSTVDKWARQLKEERGGISPNVSPMPPDQIKIRELEKKIRYIKEDQKNLHLSRHNSIAKLETYLGLVMALRDLESLRAWLRIMALR
jgi:transposase